MKKIVRFLIICVSLLLFFLTAIAPSYSDIKPSPTSSSVEEGIITLTGEKLFTLKAPVGGLSVQERAERISQRLQDFAEDRHLSLEQLEIYHGETDNLPLSMINAGNILIMLITNDDVKNLGESRQALSNQYLNQIKDAVQKYRQEREVKYLIKVTLQVGLSSIVLIIILLIISNIFAKIYHRLRCWGESYIQPITIGNWEIIKANQLDDVITWIVRISQALITIGLLAIYLPFVLEQYPWTRNAARFLEFYLFGTLKTIALAIFNYLPNLFTITTILIISAFVLNSSKPFFKDLGTGKIFLPGFYPEWAKPTYRILTFLIIVLASVIIFPLLPGFQSPAFQGISVFLGLLISLGSTSIIANLISGSILIYTRAFQVGDRIKIGDISGKVLETTLLVTRILTPLNVIVSIPNSQISTSYIENFSFGHRELNQPFIARVPLYLGYEVPWREAYQVLTQAALQTEGILKSPSPFVLQGELKEVYVIYLLNAYIDINFFKDKTLKEIEQTHSQLHENIRDCCAEAGIIIFAPSYEADPAHYGPLRNVSDPKDR